MRCRAIAIATALSSALGSPSEKAQREEEAIRRTLTLNHRALYSDKPLPVSNPFERPPSDQLPLEACSAASASSAASALFVEGHPAVVSEWVSKQSARRYEELIDSPLRPAVIAAGLDELFSSTVTSLHDGALSYFARLRVTGAAAADAVEAQRCKP